MASQLDRWLATASRGTLAFIAIVVGIFLIILFNPPQSVCDTQMDMFRQLQKGFLFPDAGTKKGKRSATYQEVYTYCQQGNSPGACYELFAKLRTLLRDLDTIPLECSPAAAGADEIKTVLWESAELMTRLAWGEKPPSTPSEKWGWLDTADISLYCGIQKHITAYFGESSWENFRERMFRDLPGAKDLPRKNAWDVMILSETPACSRYL